MNALIPSPSAMCVPEIIALCGNPGSGKSEVQKVLQRLFGHEPVDDGGPLRKIAMDYYGLTREQVYTQEGKASYVEILGRRWQVREFLGELGKAFAEHLVGEFAMPFMATRGLVDGNLYSFGSVRRNQGAFYRSIGGVVLEVVRPGVAPSPYDFDQYERKNVHATIYNTGGVEDLERAVIDALGELMTPVVLS